MSTKLLVVGSVVLINALSMPLGYAGSLEPETPPPSAIPTAESGVKHPIASTTPNLAVVEQMLPSIQPGDIEKAAASESQAKTEISVELSKAAQSVDPKPQK